MCVTQLVRLSHDVPRRDTFPPPGGGSMIHRWVGRDSPGRVDECSMPHQRGPIPLPRPVLHRLANRRAMVPISAVVIIMLAVLATWSARTMTRTAADVRRSTEISDAYQRARYALAQEQEATLFYRLTADPTVRARADRAAGDLTSALAVTRREGTTADRWLATDVLTTNQQVLTLIDDVIAAVNQNRADRAEQANNELATALPDLLRRLDRAAAAHQRKAAQAHDESRKGERVMVGVTAFAFALGLLLVLAVRHGRPLPGAARGRPLGRGGPAPVGRAHRQPDRPAEPPGVPGGSGAPAVRRRPVRIAGADRPGRAEAGQRSARPPGRRRVPDRAGRGDQQGRGRRRWRLPGRRRRVRAAARRLRRRRGTERGAAAAGDARPDAVRPGGRRDRRGHAGRSTAAIAPA